MSAALAFDIPGEPVPKARARSRVVRTAGGKAFAKHYTPGETKAYEQAIAFRCRAAASAVRWAPREGDRYALTVRVYRTHEGKGGDLDNYVKTVSDAINGIAFPDDRYVRQVSAELHRDPARPRVEVVVSVLQGVSENRAPVIPTERV